MSHETANKKITSSSLPWRNRWRTKNLALGTTIISNANFLHRLSKTRSTQRRSRMLQSASAEQLLALVETAMNILRARRPFWTRRQSQKLCKQAQLIRQLARARTPISARRLLIRGEEPHQLRQQQQQQQGEGVPALAIPLASILSSVLIPYITDYIGSTTQQE
jgi:Flp pilus assembly protein TadB